MITNSTAGLKSSKLLESKTKTRSCPGLNRGLQKEFLLQNLACSTIQSATAQGAIEEKILLPLHYTTEISCLSNIILGYQASGKVHERGGTFIRLGTSYESQQRKKKHTLQRMMLPQTSDETNSYAPKKPFARYDGWGLLIKTEN
jgi:hypothetical protein